MGTIVKLPRHARAKREQAERLRQFMHALCLSPEARAELDNVLYKIAEVPGRRWVFVMISPEQCRHVTEAILAGPDAGRTLAVWITAITYIRMDTGEVLASREQLAKDAKTSAEHVSRAMSTLTRIGAIIKQRRGHRVAYFVNPNVGWAGGEGARLEAARTAPPLRLVDVDEPVG